ncbi:hypothetical protein VTN77DRAFT_2382 [Rasamsonia byssochlamydoides]|uniref:uncharacterized protein n=1 Tax=Rasamsonia byssochlamydoides TaxID=89139 RepID=UPI003741F083
MSGDSGPVDPATGQPLPGDALQRVLFIARSVHVYTVPPLTSMKGYTAADWTTPDPRTGKTRQIFTARLRILETAIPVQSAQGDEQEKVKTDILLEDPDSGNLFAAAPYTDVGAVEHVLDSSRFFVLRVVGEGKKALLGIGFEDRSEAFDFGVSLQEARKILGFADGSSGEKRQHTNNNNARQSDQASSTIKDYSLKPGQTISVNVGRRRPAAPQDAVSPASAANEDEKALFSIPPPPPPASSITTGDQPGRRKRPTSTIIEGERGIGL